MRDYMTVLIECSVTMSVLVLGFMAIIPWLSKRYCPKWLYYIWVVLVGGLIIPFRIHFDIAFIRMDAAPSYIKKIVSGNEGNVVDLTIPTSTTPQGFSAISWYQIGSCLWLAGVFVFIVYHGLKHYRFIKMVNRWGEQPDAQILDTLQKSKTDMRIIKPVKLQICSCISTPMMTGFLNPVILLPQADFSADELPLILKHELVHVKRKDLWYKTMVFLATAIHWFNPVIYLMAKAIAVQCEISCDAEVVKGADIDRRQQYSETIIGVIKIQSRMQTTFSTNFYGGKKGMKSRIFSIMDTTKKKTGAVVFCFMLIGTMGTGVAFATNINATGGAFSTNTPISAQEQEILDRQNTEEIAKQYAVYEKYGLTYDEKTDSFYYDGKLVRFFSDKLDEDGTYNSFTRGNGVIDLKAVKNSNNELTAISLVSQEEYDKRTESIKMAQTTNTKGAVQENATANSISGSTNAVEVGGTDNTGNGTTTAFSTGDPDYVDNSLSAYLDYGVSYDKANKKWMFNNKLIHFLGDGDNMTYVDNGENEVKNGVSLKVVRNTNGQIEGLVMVSNNEDKQY